MKNVPGWKTGTWYGEPVYFTLGDKWWDPLPEVRNADPSLHVSCFLGVLRSLSEEERHGRDPLAPSWRVQRAQVLRQVDPRVHRAVHLVGRYCI